MNHIRNFLIIGFLFLSTPILAQQIPDIPSLGPAQNHYASLQNLDHKPNPARAWMDTMVHPPSLYKSTAILYAMGQPAYLSSEQVNFLIHSVEYPANSSDQTRAELDFLLDLQSKRSPEEVKRVMELAVIGYWPATNFTQKHPKYQTNLNDLFFEVQEVMGEQHTPEKYPATTHLLQGIMHDMRLMEFAVKYHLFRPRPYQLEPKLEQLQTMSSPSFASGHTLWAYCQAFTWAELMPEKRGAFLKLAYEIGLSREIVGVHYPSDEETARQLAHRMIWLMWHTQSFQEDFQKAQAEWK